MEKKVDIPENISVEIDGRTIRVKGPKGVLEKNFNNPRFNKMISIEKNGNSVIIKTLNEKRSIKAVAGTICAHTNKMIIGVTVGFNYTMEVFYSHFPMNITVKDGKVEIRNFLGEKGARVAKIAGKTEVNVEKNSVILTGIDSEELGQTASNIEQACKLSKRDKRTFLDGIYLSGRHLQSGEKI
ncbi:MAG: 50S ribosomal protein L6 [Candidatus Aenigmatarchaeota archaeon]